MRRPAARGLGEIEYLVEKTQQGDVLTERRLSGKSQPFRCPKVVYEALAKALGEAARPLSVEELVGAVERTLGVRPPDHQIRAALRFWLHLVPPLIIRSRARYKPIGSTDFASHAEKSWQMIR
jgi:hypothetical protein